MRNIINKCTSCNIYTMKDKCPECGESSINPHPPKYSPQDKYGKYRRMAKRNMQKEQGSLDSTIVSNNDSAIDNEPDSS